MMAKAFGGALGNWMSVFTGMAVFHFWGWTGLLVMAGVLAAIAVGYGLASNTKGTPQP